MEKSLSEKTKGNISIGIALVSVSILFLILEHLTHIEFMLHLAAIPIEILAAVLIVERLLEKRENWKKRGQLMYIKSYMFRSELRNLFIANFACLKSPPVTINKIKNATLEELKKFRRDAEVIEYKSLEAMELIILEYVRTRHVWQSFLERSITYNFEDIFLDMISIIHFIHGAKTFKEKNPNKLFIHEAAKNDRLMQDTHKILGDGIQRFLDYAIELKEKQPKLFYEVLSDYEMLSKKWASS
jgi:hypothetical protein